MHQTYEQVHTSHRFRDTEDTYSPEPERQDSDTSDFADIMEEIDEVLDENRLVIELGQRATKYLSRPTPKWHLAY